MLPFVPYDICWGLNFSRRELLFSGVATRPPLQYVDQVLPSGHERPLPAHEAILRVSTSVAIERRGYVVNAAPVQRVGRHGAHPHTQAGASRQRSEG